MELFENKVHLNNLKIAEKKFRENAQYFSEVSDLFSQLIAKLESKLDHDSQVLKDLSYVRTLKLKQQTLELRKEFVKLNFFNPNDLENLVGVLRLYTSNDTPALELFPGTGQFLPYAVAAEPLYIADRFIEICNEAAVSLNNEFYANRRLRKYEIKEDDYSVLPGKSFGFVYCFNEFFSANEDYIITIAKQVYDLLYDGGKFAFNFIPHDQHWAQVASVNYQYSCLNYNIIIEELEKLGYVMVNYKLQPLKSSYIIMKKGNTEPEPRIKIGGAWAEIIDN